MSGGNSSAWKRKEEVRKRILFQRKVNIDKREIFVGELL